MSQLHNVKQLKFLRRELRSHLTPAEAILWKALQRSQLESKKFRRQHSIGSFIVDFYCDSERIVIELDGHPHYSYAGTEADQTRDNLLKELGMKVLRFENKDVYENLEGVLEEIRLSFKS